MPIGLLRKRQRGPQGEACGPKFPSSFPLSRGLKRPIFRFRLVIFILSLRVSAGLFVSPLVVSLMFSSLLRSLTHLFLLCIFGIFGETVSRPNCIYNRGRGALRKSSGLWALSVSRPPDLSMALTATKLHTTPVVSAPSATCEPRAVSCSVSSSHHQSLSRKIHEGNSIELRKSGYRLWYCGRSFKCLCAGFITARRTTAVCLARRGSKAETEGIVTRSVHHSDTASDRCKNEETGHHYAPTKVICSKRALAEACKYVYNDAKYVNERARNDIILLSRGILSLDARARQDLAFLESAFLKVDARVREDTEKIIDNNVKEKAERLHHITTLLKEKAKTELKSVADQHWSDGALEADLRRADFHAKQRAMEDTIMALEFLKNIRDRMVDNMYKFPLGRENGPPSSSVVLEKNGKNLDFLSKEVSDDRIAAIQEAYRSMASALSIADGIDYTNPEELELLITTLIDLDAMDGKSSVMLLAECSKSPDVNTRRALANALASAPSMWTLGNAGMGALQRLSEDSNPTVARAASRAIQELKKQWEIEEGDSFRFVMNESPSQEGDSLGGVGGSDLV
ncbi:hypothetical protein Droror1_Dr00022562 [Drosera rotundifolia]